MAASMALEYAGLQGLGSGCESTAGKGSSVAMVAFSQRFTPTQNRELPTGFTIGTFGMGEHL